MALAHRRASYHNWSAEYFVAEEIADETTGTAGWRRAKPCEQFSRLETAELRSARVAHTSRRFLSGCMRPSCG